MESVLLISLATFCIHVSITWDGFIFNPLLPYLSRLPNFIRKPLYECFSCMGGIYSVAILIMEGRALDSNFLIFVLAVVGLNSIISIFIRLIEAIENLEQPTQSNTPPNELP